MYATEKEAKFKYCPLLTTHDDKLKFCQGAMCMMWRTAGPDKGYCGLAGRPGAAVSAGGVDAPTA